MVSYWLIVPQSKQAFIYRKDGSVDILKSFDEKLSGENVLPGFVFELHNLKLTHWPSKFKANSNLRGLIPYFITDYISNNILCSNFDSITLLI